MGGKYRNITPPPHPPKIYKITRNYWTGREVTGIRGGGGDSRVGREEMFVKVTRKRTLHIKLGKLFPYLAVN